MHKYNGKSIRKVETSTGKIPDNMGFPGNMKGITRKLTKSDIAQMKRNGIKPPFYAQKGVKITLRQPVKG